MNLKITSEGGMINTDFLDIHFNLATGKYKPFFKNNEFPVYINKSSNHPNAIKRQIPRTVSERISKLSSDIDTFMKIKQPYESALKKSGFSENLEYTEEKRTQKRKRVRPVIWFNPPFSLNVKTNIGKKFLSLVDKHFGSSNLKKYFNRNTIKLSYSCMPNIGTIISGHNRRILEEKKYVDLQNVNCNCRGTTISCPLDGNCLKKSIIYKADVRSNGNEASYIGLSSGSFKTRFANHKKSFKHEISKNETALSNYVWNLKRNNENFEIKWSVLSENKQYDPGTTRCYLCTAEKSFILFFKDGNQILNKKTELMSKCPHRDQFLLKNYLN